MILASWNSYCRDFPKLEIIGFSGEFDPAIPALYPLAMEVSFVVPAHNEERWIGGTLDAIITASEGLSEETEIIVVSDASTDETERIAAEKGAIVLQVNHRNVAAVRNTGVKEAKGRYLFFVDADTRTTREAVTAGLEAMKSGAAGGGCLFKFDEKIPFWAAAYHRLGLFFGRILKMTGGCFVFCTRETFESSGGFSEVHRAGEDMAFVESIKSVGQFVIPKPMVATSARKLTVVGFIEVSRLVATIALRGANYESERTLDFMYGKRAEECRRGGKEQMMVSGRLR